MLEASKVPVAPCVDTELQDHLRSLAEEVVDNLTPGICSAAHRVEMKPPQMFVWLRSHLKRGD